MSGRHVLVADVHGGHVPGHPEIDAYREHLLPWLHGEGWRVCEHRSGLRYLHHPSDTLLVLGDVIDCGPSSVEAALLLYGSYAGALELGLLPSVVTLMGNHDVRLRQRFLEGSRVAAKEFRDTEAALRERPADLRRIVRWVDMLPYTYNARSFRAAHAQFSSSTSLCLYGPVERGLDADGKPRRIPWWHDPPAPGVTFFGHYRMAGEWLDPGRGSVCLDNWSGGLMTIALVDAAGRIDVLAERVV